MDLGGAPTRTLVGETTSTAAAPTGGIDAMAIRPYQPAPWLGRMAALIGVFLVGVDYYFMMGGSVGLLWIILFAPVWYGKLRAYALARTVAVAVPLTLIAGIALSVNATVDHRVDIQHMQIFIGVALTGCAGFVAILWARSFASIHTIAVLYGMGVLVKAVMRSEFTWKFGLSIPITFIVLGLLGGSRSRVTVAAATVGLGVFGVATGYRSYFAFCLVSATMFLWQSITNGSNSSSENKGLRRWAPAILMASVGLVIYFSASAMLTAGVFGKSLQQRSVSQVEASGTLIAGGRPEWAATRQLMRTRPHGFGIGVVPTWNDLRAGVLGMASINVDGGGYTKYYMFGGSFELHSVLSDWWVNTGFAGIALSLLVLYCLVRNISTLLSSRSADMIVLFTTNLALWSMLFGPLYTDWLSIGVALGLSMLPRSPGHPVNTAPAPA